MAPPPPSQDSISSGGNYFDSSFLLEKLTSIQRLEAELESSTVSRTDAAGQDPQVRIRLCELYSGCLLRNPAFSWENNLLERLWRNCFYQRIGDERSDIARRKRKNPESVTHAMNVFSRFIQEAIDLYGYLAKFYMSLVAPLNAAVQGSQSYDLSQDDLDEAGKKAVVAILHKFEIYLGDLNRYREKFQEASCHYERAAMLAPGQGNPYNQLAVLEQLKNSSCNALYWYSRSISASKKPFEISLSNLERLFALNRKWLAENPEIHVPVTTKKHGVDAARARKAAASKHLAASFVDLQQRVRDTAKPDVEGQVARKTVLGEMDSVISHLESLLSGNGLSDTLLCRMVVINAFTSSQFDVSMTKALVWRFGTALAKRVEYVVNKIIETTPDNPSSIRALSALLLTCDYVSYFESDDDGIESDESKFWSKICDIANQLVSLIHTLRLKDVLIKGKLPKEYTDLIGFSPFETFIEKPDDFLSIEDAREVLPLLQDLSPSVSLKKQSQEGTSNVLDIRIKLAYFLSIVDGSPKVKKGSDDSYHFVGAMEVVDSDDFDVPANFDDSPMETHIDPEDDVLTYRAPEHGGGPPLLVPGALLLSMIAKRNPEQMGSSLASSTGLVNGNETITSSDQKDTEMQVVKDTPATSGSGLPTPMEVASPIVQAILAPGALPPGFRPPPGLPAPPGFPQQADSITTTSSILRGIQPPTWDFLSLQPTANPFAQPVTENYSAAGSRRPASDPNDYLDHDETMKFLDSSLRQSIWYDDANQPASKNPFLAGAK